MNLGSLREDAFGLGNLYRLHPIVTNRGQRLVCNLYSTQRPPSGCRSSGTDRHLLLPEAKFFNAKAQRKKVNYTILLGEIGVWRDVAHSGFALSSAPG
jgi:hypothetical protein